MSNRLTLEDLIPGTKVQSTLSNNKGTIKSYKDESNCPCEDQFPSHGYFLRIEWENGNESVIPLNQNNPRDLEWFEGLELVKV